MDEVNIRSTFLQGILSNVIKKIVKQKIGIQPDSIRFNDAIEMIFDGEKASIHLNLDVKFSKEDLQNLLKNLI